MHGLNEGHNRTLFQAQAMRQQYSYLSANGITLKNMGKYIT